VIRLRLTGGKNYAEHGTAQKAKGSIHIGTIIRVRQKTMIQR
jgi:hypothetical protein